MLNEFKIVIFTSIEYYQSYIIKIDNKIVGDNMK